MPKSPQPAYTLSQLDVYNWGPFSGRHHMDIDPAGTAIIGPTGSGKTTLIDAFMTLITANPRYNLASTGGHESDRDLVSYVRGKTGSGNQSDNRHIIRTSKTISAIEASFYNGQVSVSIAAIFWFDSSSSATTDLKRLWIFNQSEQSQLDQWLELLHEYGIRAVKQLAKETSGLRVWDNKKPYLAQLRRFFDVGDNAFTLLNRAAGLKQLNSIDEIFRELVLDDHSAFSRAKEVANEFDDLASIHQELETARAQQLSLLPIKKEQQKHQKK